MAVLLNALIHVRLWQKQADRNHSHKCCYRINNYLMKFNTAIFYDIENLIGGYGSGHMELLLNLSLKQINLLIQEKGYGKIAIRRGYADWSNTRLCQLKSDIVELGIEPRQLFGFGKGGLKNASDIYMVVDVMEVLFSKPEIEHFVIVSGDGGFSPLANKLHEYGKVVVGCAYRRQTNKLFEATTDEFIWLTDPLGAADTDCTGTGFLLNCFHSCLSSVFAV